jgi:hypothetical protein
LIATLIPGLLLAVRGMGNTILHRSGVPTLVMSFDPPSPSISAAASGGSVVAVVNVRWTNGAPFTGTLGFTAPYSDDGAVFALSGNQVIINPHGPGIGADGNTTQLTSIIATQ